jgi:hypothetical protein
VTTFNLVTNFTIVTLVTKFTSILTGTHVTTVTMVINVTIHFFNIMEIFVTKIINVPMVSLGTEFTNISMLRVAIY